MSQGTSAPIILGGKNAFSQFRIDALMKRIEETAPSLAGAEIEAQLVYFIEASGALNDDASAKSYTLLDAVEPLGESPDGFFVIPRLGTISPWSSKASDIFHNCGVNEVTRVEHGILYRISHGGKVLDLGAADSILPLICDRMTESACTDVSKVFEHIEPRPLVTVDIVKGGKEALVKANVEMGLALSPDEVDYLYDAYNTLQRNPSDAELVMFGQVNSEHCRHKIFNADWIVDGESKDISLFNMIRNTDKVSPAGTLGAYEDNAAVIEGFKVDHFEAACDQRNAYGHAERQIDISIKVETHNHPTAISPYAGAATGIGGEIRDEVATGIGGKTKAGLAGFMVSNLRLPGYLMPWEKDYAEFPRRLATPLEIMIEGPIGGAAFGNEFGRPQLCGFFKTYEEEHNGRYRGYHKPIMIAGGTGIIKREHVEKRDIPVGAHIIQIGGPAMRIGLGGGAASSMDTGSNEEQLDFDSVQRGNAEMQRRCQGVIDGCMALGTGNPICSIHDLGAGGLSNGCPELISETGGKFWLRKVHNEEISMSPMEIWCCEAQERYVLAVMPDGLDEFLAICARERCEVAVIGEATGDDQLVLEDSHFENNPIDMELKLILGKPPKTLRDVTHVEEKHADFDTGAVDFREAAERVLRLPAVGDKTFLISIADRTVVGMTARDQMVGPYQVPLADVAVNTISYKGYTGSAMAMGERSAAALISGPASGRMAIGEALTNICASNIGAIGNVKLSANWMCACGQDGEDASLYDTVRAVGMELCPALGISIPVGKDSLSMRTIWDGADGAEHKMVAPLSLVVTSFASVMDVRKTLTPDLKRAVDSKLMLIDLGRGKSRIGCSALTRVYNEVGSDCADVDSAEDLSAFFKAIQELGDKELLLAYHDRSDGGMFAAAAEMSFGGRRGADLVLDDLGDDPVRSAFAEELGAVIQIDAAKAEEVLSILASHGLSETVQEIGAPRDDGRLVVKHGDKTLLDESVADLNQMWSELTYRMQALRDNPECAIEEFDSIQDSVDPGMNFDVTYEPLSLSLDTRPSIAILREQGINGHQEMAAAFDAAGFESVDVHMTDLLEGRKSLSEFAGLVSCGGFSYGDVLGAGSGWARSVLFNDGLKGMFDEFFHRPDTFALGVCNGCQMVSQLKELIPGAEHWPEFSRNRSEQFESRYVTVEVLPSPSILLKGMEGARIPIPVAHGEGRVDFASTGSLEDVEAGGLAALRYIDNLGSPASAYPLNPNGSPGGMTALTSTDGRVTIMMPHPERAFRAVQLSYRGGIAGEAGPWLRMFQNARAFVG